MDSQKLGAMVLSDAYVINPKLILFILSMVLYFDLFVVKRRRIIILWAIVTIKELSKL